MSVPAPSTERQARAQMIATCRGLDPAGLNSGRAGNLSHAWHRGARPGMLITPSALPYERMQPDDLVWMPLDQPLEPPGNEGPEQFGDRPASTEWRMHLALQQAPGERTGSVLHVHSPYATTLASLPRIQQHGIPAWHYMIAVAGGNDIRCAPYATFGSIALCRAMLVAMQGRRACLLANHGQIVTGADPRDAFELACEVESLARGYWQALQLGEPVVLDDAAMADVHRQFAASAYRAP